MENPQVLAKKLLFRSAHRGCKESDIILGKFAETHLKGFSEAQLYQFEAILDCDDSDIFDWLTGKASPPADVKGEVLDKLLKFKVYEQH